MGIEPTTSAWKAEVLPLNYTRTLRLWGGWWESNPRMSEPQSDALTTSPQPPKYNAKKWFRTESNCRHMELQSIALPTELWTIMKMAVPMGFEPTISCVTGRRVNRYTTGPLKIIAGGGFEPPTFGLWARRATELLHPAIIILMAEEEGFEPPRAVKLLSVFKTDPFSRTWVFLQKY